jgi:hypothetical protein
MDLQAFLFLTKIIDSVVTLVVVSIAMFVLIAIGCLGLVVGNSIEETKPSPVP